MAFRTALKNLISHFGVIWSLLVYIVAVTAILVGLSLPFLLPVARAFAEAGIFEGLWDALYTLFGDGGWRGFCEILYELYMTVNGIFENNGTVASLTMMFLIFVAVVAFRFFFGLYEIPLASVLDGSMSCNAKYGFGGKFFSTLPTSVLYSLAKMPIMIAFDAVTLGIIYGLSRLIGLNFILPIVSILIMCAMRAFRSSMFSCWAAAVVGGSGVIGGFAKSVEICFKRFGSIYSTYFVTWMLIIAFVLFLTIFTLGAGLIVAVPISTAFLSYIGITEYYLKTGRRFYVDGVVVTPSTENAIADDEPETDEENAD